MTHIINKFDHRAQGRQPDNILTNDDLHQPKQLIGEVEPNWMEAVQMLQASLEVLINSMIDGIEHTIVVLRLNSKFGHNKAPNSVQGDVEQGNDRPGRAGFARSLENRLLLFEQHRDLTLKSLTESLNSPSHPDDGLNGPTLATLYLLIFVSVQVRFQACLLTPADKSPPALYCYRDPCSCQVRGQ